MGYPKKHRGRRKMGSKKRRARKKNKKKQFSKSNLKKKKHMNFNSLRALILVIKILSC